MIETFADGALTLEIFQQHAVLTLDQPARKNAMSQAMWRALPEALATVDRSSAKVLVLTGAGGVFSAGADISEFERVWANAESAQAYAELITQAVNALSDFSKPTLAAVRGPCVGGGMALALACDLRVADSSARFGITPAKLGLVYSLEDTKRLVDAVGPANAKDILFTGRILDAEEARAIGLLNLVVPPESFDAALQTKVDQIAAASQWSTRGIKAIIGLILAGQSRDDDRTRAAFLEATQAADFQEGRAAFLEKRKPNFPFR
ncbi:enoyl-CoA hydratase-related protein [Caulobacter sp. BP25]|uniref:enoyl-CoA hydratase-related protein n=1 Tax=Caulobacter sp. BP25 TaxID=2048900 RepID=UPI000C12C0C6|nr:enoyl-CoA hydratase-related protein [Caulobacter sp. BP25]PHY19719.1 enoyl-CoA hydratase [Caulobacter sp. BP25]